MTLKLICAVALLLAVAQRDRIAAVAGVASATLRPVLTLPRSRPDKIGAVR